MYIPSIWVQLFGTGAVRAGSVEGGPYVTLSLLEFSVSGNKEIIRILLLFVKSFLRPGHYCSK